MVSLVSFVHFILIVAGHCRVNLKETQLSSTEWARLDFARETTVSQFVNAIREPSSALAKFYLFDWSLPIHCPELSSEFTVPK
jgi:hypothetical protein